MVLARIACDAQLALPKILRLRLWDKLGRKEFVARILSSSRCNFRERKRLSNGLNVQGPKYRIRSEVLD